MLNISGKKNNYGWSINTSRDVTRERETQGGEKKEKKSRSLSERTKTTAGHLTVPFKVNTLTQCLVHNVRTVSLLLTSLDC